MAGDLSREHWIVPVHGVTPADPDGIVQAIARCDGAVNLHLSCGELRATVQLDACRAAQLSTGIWEAAGAALRLTGYPGADQSPAPQPPPGSEDLPEAWRTHLNASPRQGVPRRRRRPAPASKGAAREATRMIGLRLRRIRHARGKSLRVISGLAGMSSSTLHRIEHGQCDVTFSEIMALAKALEINPAKLITLPILVPATDHKTG